MVCPCTACAVSSIRTREINRCEQFLSPAPGSYASESVDRLCVTERTPFVTLAVVTLGVRLRITRLHTSQHTSLRATTFVLVWATRSTRSLLQHKVGTKLVLSTPSGECLGKVPVANNVVRQGQQVLQVRSVLFRVKDDWYASALCHFSHKKHGEIRQKGAEGY